MIDLEMEETEIEVEKSKNECKVMFKKGEGQQLDQWIESSVKFQKRNKKRMDKKVV